MYKNTTGQKIACYAWDGAAGTAKTGDAANITAQISIDGAATAATNDVSPTELDAADAPGIYIFDLTQAETNGDMIVIAPVSSTPDITIRPIISYTNPVIAANITAIQAVTDALPNAGALTDIDTGINNIETAVITNAAGVDVAADIIALKAETALIVGDTNELQTDDTPAALAAIDAKIDTAQIDLDTITGADGVTLATAQGLYAPNKIVPDAAGTAAALHAITDGLVGAIDVGGSVIEGTVTLKQAVSIILAALAGKATGGGTIGIIFRNQADDTNRLVLTVDANGNRSATVIDVSDL